MPPAPVPATPVPVGPVPANPVPTRAELGRTLRRDLANRDIVRIGSHRFLFVPLCGEDFYWDGEGVLQ